MRPVGFSTGAIAKGDVRRALELLSSTDADAVELSALRAHELEPLMRALPTLELARFRHVSVHAPSRFAAEQESAVVGLLRRATERGLDVVVHPDAVHDAAPWAALGDRLCLENMDKRKPVGRTAAELAVWFARLPEAGLCFDIAHARQVDGSMLEGHRIATRYAGRMRQLHLSEVTTDSRHSRVSVAAAHDFRLLLGSLPPDVPVIVEAVVTPEEVATELGAARELVDHSLQLA